MIKKATSTKYKNLFFRRLTKEEAAFFIFEQIYHPEYDSNDPSCSFLPVISFINNLAL
jgi:hypothetical protein